MPESVKMLFTSASNLNRWGLPARTNSSVVNSNRVANKASHRTYNTLFTLQKMNKR